MLMLGKVYAETAVGYNKISITRMIEEHVPGFPAPQALIRAMFTMEILQKEDEAQRNPPVHWNSRKWGAPSLVLVDNLLVEAEVVRLEWYRVQRERAYKRSLKHFTLSVAKGTRRAQCCHCPFYGCQKVCDFFASQGFRCRSYNMDTIKIGTDEAGMG